jgi:hypothetical protein
MDGFLDIFGVSCFFGLVEIFLGFPRCQFIAGFSLFSNYSKITRISQTITQNLQFQNEKLDSTNQFRKSIEKYASLLLAKPKQDIKKIFSFSIKYFEKKKILKRKILLVPIFATKFLVVSVNESSCKLLDNFFSSSFYLHLADKFFEFI